MSLFPLHQTSLKICGITRPEDAQRLVDLKVHALGVNFCKTSKRYISPKHSTFFRDFTGEILRVGVFVNSAIEEVIALLEQDIIDVPQFHGNESLEYCKFFTQKGIPFIKAVRVKNESSLEQISLYQPTIALLDTYHSQHYGGSGETFDWSLAKKSVRKFPHTPIILAGGLTALNIAEAQRTVNPAGLDLASGAESTPGIKDFDKIQQIIAQVS